MFHDIATILLYQILKQVIYQIIFLLKEGVVALDTRLPI